MGDTAISWTHRPGTRGRTWNPTKGCSRVSAGCQRCYAEVQAARIVRMGRGKPTAYSDLVRVTAGGDPRWTGKVVLDVETLAAPLGWREPSTVFVNSMSDLFHESLTNEQIAAVFGVMAATPRHVYQILTKRADRMRAWFEWFRDQMGGNHDMGAETEVLIDLIADAAPGEDVIGDRIVQGQPWPLPNVWLGVSVENQDAADERILQLLKTPAAVRFLSCEPLLGDVDLRAYLSKGNYLVCPQCRFASNAPTALCANGHGRMVPDFGIDQIIIGAESGPGARPADPAWFRSIVAQCRAAGVAVFVKQIVVDGKLRRDVSDFPADLQIQEFPR